MKKKIFTTLALILVLVSGGIYMYNKLIKPNFSPKTAKLYQHGFRLLEDNMEPISKNTIKVLKRLSFPQSTLLREGQLSQMPMYVRRFMINMVIKQH